MEQVFYVRSGGATTGPFTASHLQKLVRRQQVTRGDYLSTDRREWKPAYRYAALFPDGAATADDAAGDAAHADVDAVRSAEATVRSAAAPPQPASRIDGLAEQAAPSAASAGVGFSIRARGLGREVTDKETGEPRMLIRDIDMVLKPGELVALVGGSGAGKSTLFGAISGRVRGTHGQVLYDGQDLYANFESLRGDIGYVPQRDVFHDSLTVSQALRATSRLRLPRSTPPADIEANIDRVLKTVSLTKKRTSVIASLSGGEQKRVGIAMELLSRPRVLFLDEPCAPLDPRTAAEMMTLFRELAGSGLTVILITHAAGSLSVVDVVAYMHFGVLTFQGAPSGIMTFFGVENMADTYGVQDRQSPQAWRDQYMASPEGRNFLASRHGRSIAGPRAAADPARKRDGGLAATVHQTVVLTARYFRILTAGRVNLAILLLLAPIVTSMLCLATGTIDTSDAGKIENFFAKQKMLCFGSVMVTIFLALFSSVREIVKELPIYLHEHFVNVEVLPYLLSKVIVLLTVGAVQAAMVVAVINGYGGIEEGTWLFQYGILFLCSAVGTMLGLLISAAVTQADQAVTGMILIVIPEILFSGALIQIKDISKYIAGPLITAYWGFNAMMSKLPEKVDQPTFNYGQRFVEVAPSTLMMAGQFAALAVLTYWLMVRKDGPGAAERIAEQMKRTVLRQKP